MAQNDKDNVVHLGRGDLAAIGKALRDMYEFYLHSKPPDRIERLAAIIAQGGADQPAEPTDPEGQAAAPAEGDVTPP